MKPFIAMHLRGERLRQTVVQQIGPIRMRLRLSDDVQRQIFLGLYENEEIETCRPLVSAGGTCMDVGANVGWFSLHFASLAGATGRVIACEADPDVANELRANIRLNEFVNRVEVVNQAISDTAGNVEFRRSAPEHSGWGSVLTQPGNRDGKSITVPAVTLDSLIRARGIDCVDVLKIDVEGNEFAVLKGATDSLRGSVFRNIMIEWAGAGQTAHGRTIQQLHRSFSSKGYVPDRETARRLEAFQSGSADPQTAFLNLLYRANGVAK